MSAILAAKKNPLLNRLIYRLLIKPPLQSSFHSVRYREVEPVGATDAPIIIIGNHSAWWDGHLPMLANEDRWHTDGYVIAEDTQLSRYQFFRYVGAFSVNRSDVRSAMESLNYAAALLTEAPRRMLLVFPQGEILANDIRPLKFFGGVGRILKKVVELRGECNVYPMALRYEFVGEQKPEAFISIGAPLRYTQSQVQVIDPRQATAEMESAVTRELDKLRDDVTAYRFDDFTPLMKGGWSINRVWDTVRGKNQIKRVGGM